MTFKCTLLYALTYNTGGYFASCVVFFQAPKGRGKIRAKSKCPHVLYVKPYNKVFVIPLMAPFSSSLVLSFLNPAYVCRELRRSNKRALVAKTIQTESFKRPLKFLNFIAIKRSSPYC